MKAKILSILMSLLVGASVWGQSMDLVSGPIARMHSMAEKGNASAMFSLGRLYEQGYGSIKADSAKSIDYYIKAAEHGHLQALNLVGYRFCKGEGVPKDFNRGIAYIAQAAEKGDAAGLNNMGYFLLINGGPQKNDTLAAGYLRKAADKDLPVAMTQLADLYAIGRGVEKDTAEALHLYDKALMQGFVKAAPKLYDLGRKYWVNLPADSLLALGCRYYTTMAPQLGLMLLRPLADAENPHALAIMADASAKGSGTQYNHDLSVELFYLAAKGGNPSAQFILGELLESFPDSLKNIDAAAEDSGRPAVYWLDKAREQGITDADTAYMRLYRP